MAPKYTNKLSNARVLILGGTSGIGFCVAENALEHGASVIVASSRQSSVDKALSRLAESYPDRASSVSGYTIDLKSDDVERSIITLLQRATDDGKHPLDHIVTTASDSLPLQPLSDLAGTPTTLLDATRVRVFAPMLLAKHATATYLRRSSRSSITLTGGVNSYRPGTGWVLPAVSGSATDGLARSLAVDLRPVRVNLIAPGAVETELFRSAFPPDRLDAVREGYARQTLVGAVGTPEDVSEAYLYCMKDGFVTGQVILSEGGLLLAPRAD